MAFISFNATQVQPQASFDPIPVENTSARLSNLKSNPPKPE